MPLLAVPVQVSLTVPLSPKSEKRRKQSRAWSTASAPPKICPPERSK